MCWNANKYFPFLFQQENQFYRWTVRNSESSKLNIFACKAHEFKRETKQKTHTVESWTKSIEKFFNSFSISLERTEDVVERQQQTAILSHSSLFLTSFLFLVCLLPLVVILSREEVTLSKQCLKGKTEKAIAGTESTNNGRLFIFHIDFFPSDCCCLEAFCW